MSFRSRAITALTIFLLFFVVCYTADAAGAGIKVFAGVVCGIMIGICRYLLNNSADLGICMAGRNAGGGRNEVYR